MLNQLSDPIELHRSATDRAVAIAEAVRPEQLDLPTPCSESTVQDLFDHLGGGAECLRAAVAGRVPVPSVCISATDYRSAVEQALGDAAAPGVMERMCLSPLGFEWTVRDAVAGTFMDVLIHTWDLAHGTVQDAALEPALVDACVAMFLLQMPEMGREAGIIGPAVDVGPDAAPQTRLLAAMGRRP
jgi:uncharacterized protein (TIGR03086 family)